MLIGDRLRAIREAKKLSLAGTRLREANPATSSLGSCPWTKSTGPPLTLTFSRDYSRQVASFTKEEIPLSAEKPSLYDRFGGVYSIATVIDDLVDRIMVDPRLNANPLV